MAIACFGGVVAGPGFVGDGPGVSYPGYKEFCDFISMVVSPWFFAQ